MKKIYVTLFFMICSATLFAQIPNHSFENWNTFNYDNPDGWENGNRDGIGNFGIAPITKIVHAPGYAVRIETKFSGPDLVEAFIANGDPFKGMGGVPCGPNPTAITGSYRYGIQPLDSAIILVFFKNNGAVFSDTMFYIKGNQNSFTNFSFPISLSMPADTVIFAAASSNLLAMSGVTAGSFLELDNIALAGTAIPIPNGNFENWTPVTFDKLLGWEGYGDISKTGGYIGNAVKLTTVLDNNMNINSAGITSGHNSNSGSAGGMPYTLLSDTLTGYYKYIAPGSDSGTIYVTMSKNASPVGGNYKVIYPTANYTYFEMKLNAGQVPDTLRIDANSSAYPPSTNSIGSSLYLDELHLKSQGTVSIFHSQNNLTAVTYLYPNPARDAGVIKLSQPIMGTVLLSIYDASGRMVQQNSFNNTGLQLPLNISSLSAGMYYYEVSSGNICLQNKFVKE